MANNAPASREPDTPRRRWPRLLLWFTLGTVLVFVGLALILDHGFYNGEAVYTVPLWRYYLMELQLAWHSSGNLGPTSGNAEAAVTTAIQHVLVSLAGGAVAMGLAWAIGRSRRSS